MVAVAVTWTPPAVVTAAVPVIAACTRPLSVVVVLEPTPDSSATDPVMVLAEVVSV